MADHRVDEPDEANERRPRLRWEDGVAVITGGAAGIGLACAERFGDRGMHLVIADKDRAALETARRRLQRRFPGPLPRLLTLEVDVTSDEDVEELAATVLERFGHVDLVMANAGVAVGGTWEHVPSAEWLRLLDVNVVGTARLVRVFAPMLRQQRGGHVVVTSSSAGLFPDDGSAGPYVASKAGLVAMARSMAAYFAPHRVGVTVLCPRLTDTAFPRSADVYSRRGRTTTANRAVEDADNPDMVADALIAGMDEGQFLVSLTPDSALRLEALAHAIDYGADL